MTVGALGVSIRPTADYHSASEFLLNWQRRSLLDILHDKTR